MSKNWDEVEGTGMNTMNLGLEKFGTKLLKKVFILHGLLSVLKHLLSFAIGKILTFFLKLPT